MSEELVERYYAVHAITESCDHYNYMFRISHSKPHDVHSVGVEVMTELRRVMGYEFFHINDVFVTTDINKSCDPIIYLIMDEIELHKKEME